MTIVADNTPRDDSADELLTFALNRHFELAGIGDRQSIMLAYKNSDGHTIARGSSIASVTSLFLFFSIDQLSTSAQLHRAEIAIEPRKAPLLLYLMSHQCTDTCTADHWVFIRKLYPRTGPFVARTPLLGVNPSAPLTLSDMNNLNPLPVQLHNDVRTQRRSQPFDTPTMLPTLYHADMGG
ncbi:hypothetical protein C8R44DRAFT_747776 [Mycena epipterygia]|nr:hypothetical protein C8R44DRAFT_747776 [Mycena epipterygia]